MSFKRIEFTKKVKKMVEVVETHNQVVYQPYGAQPGDVIRYAGNGQFEYSANGGGNWSPLRIHDWIGDGTDLETLEFLEALAALIKTYDAEKVS